MVGACLLSVCWIGCNNEPAVTTVPATDPASSSTVPEGSESICPQCQRRYFSGERFCMVDKTQLLPAAQAKSIQKAVSYTHLTLPTNREV